MTLQLVDDPLPTVELLQTLVEEVVAQLDLRRPRQRWSLEGPVGPAQPLALDHVLAAAPPEELLGERALERGLTYFSAAEHDFVRRQARRSLERIVVLDQMVHPEPGQSLLRLSEPLVSKDGARLVLWAICIQYERRGSQWCLQVHIPGELAFVRKEDKWLRSEHRPGTQAAFEALFP